MSAIADAYDETAEQLSLFPAQFSRRKEAFTGTVESVDSAGCVRIALDKPVRERDFLEYRMLVISDQFFDWIGDDVVNLTKALKAGTYVRGHAFVANDGSLSGCEFDKIAPMPSRAELLFAQVGYCLGRYCSIG